MIVSRFYHRFQRCWIRLIPLLAVVWVTFCFGSGGLQAQPPAVIPSVPVRPQEPPFTPPVANPYPESGGNYYASVEPSPTTDVELQRSVRNQFAADTLLRSFGIHVEVRNGIAILTGNADTWQDYTRAEADAYAAGAQAVNNQLRVQFR